MLAIMHIDWLKSVACVASVASHDFVAFVVHWLFFYG